MTEYTDIMRIGGLRSGEEEFVSFTKTFRIAFPVIKADLKLTTEGVCAVYVNGVFAEGHNGRLPNRVLFVGIASLLKPGDNQIRLIAGSHYYQKTADKNYRRRGERFYDVAAEALIECENEKLRIVTDGSWKAAADGVCGPAEVLTPVTVAQYDRFWRHAAYFSEKRTCEVPEPVRKLAGQGYEEFLKTLSPEYAVPVRTSKDPVGEYYALNRLEVGYLEVEYESDDFGEAVFFFDYSEKPEDFLPESKFNKVVSNLSVRVKLKPGNNTLRLVRRRAFRYMKAILSDGARILSCRLRLSSLPARGAGWFYCGDGMLNRIWEVSRHTLEVNKHLEYESCPRSEMKFFSGDGVVSALTDYYAFGESTLCDASLSCTELASAVGLRRDPTTSNDALWDYTALRIIMTVDLYRYFGDRELLRHYWKDLTDCAEWLTEKAGPDGLIYQFPVWFDVFFSVSDAVDYSCSEDRLGIKTYLNALYYEALKRMSEAAEVLEDPRKTEWSVLAGKVRDAINSRLWDESSGTYRDPQYPNILVQDGNALAALFGIADKDRAKRVLDSMESSLRTPRGNRMYSPGMTNAFHKDDISPLICGYEAEARFVCGDPKSALDLIKRCWGTMINKGAGTFWEYSPDDPDKRWNIPSHAWSSAPGYLLPAYACGIRPVLPGFETLGFCPAAGFGPFVTVVPTASGYVAARCDIREGAAEYALALPKDMGLETSLPEGSKLTVIRYE